MIRFSVLLDENVNGRVDRALRRLGPEVCVLRVGHEGAPPVGSSDPDLLAFAEASGSAIVTHDRPRSPRTRLPTSRQAVTPLASSSSGSMRPSAA